MIGLGNFTKTNLIHWNYLCLKFKFHVVQMKRGSARSYKCKGLKEHKICEDTLCDFCSLLIDERTLKVRLGALFERLGRPNLHKLTTCLLLFIR